MPDFLSLRAAYKVSFFFGEGEKSVPNIGRG